VPLLDEAAELLGRDDSTARRLAEELQTANLEYAQGVLDLLRGSESGDFEDEESEILAAFDLVDAQALLGRQEATDHRTAAERAATDRTWRFGHIVVDEAQEVSPMAWRLLMRRSRSMTLVGDVAQTGDPAGASSWPQALGPHVGNRWRLEELTVNYRMPEPVARVATGLLRALDPDRPAPEPVRRDGAPPWALHTGTSSGSSFPRCTPKCSPWRRTGAWPWSPPRTRPPRCSPRSAQASRNPLPEARTRTTTTLPGWLSWIRARPRAWSSTR
jgi:hypothetical protein